MSFDEIAHDSRFLPFSGWHDDYVGKTGAEYMPAAQQVRSEFLQLAARLTEVGIAGSNGSCLQIGLGHAGASHNLFQWLFGRVHTIETRPEIVETYLQRFPGADIIGGDSKSPAIVATAKSAAPFDFLFIDGGHFFADVYADFSNYAPMVREGGMIALHDAVQSGPGLEVSDFVRALKTTRWVHVIGDQLGIAWLVV